MRHVGVLTNCTDENSARILAWLGILRLKKELRAYAYILAHLPTQEVSIELQRPAPTVLPAIQSNGQSYLPTTCARKRFACQAASGSNSHARVMAA